MTSILLTRSVKKNFISSHQAFSGGKRLTDELLQRGAIQKTRRKNVAWFLHIYKN